MNDKPEPIDLDMPHAVTFHTAARYPVTADGTDLGDPATLIPLPPPTDLLVIQPPEDTIDVVINGVTYPGCRVVNGVLEIPLPEMPKDWCPECDGPAQCPPGSCCGAPPEPGFMIMDGCWCGPEGRRHKRGGPNCVAPHVDDEGNHDFRTCPCDSCTHLRTKVERSERAHEDQFVSADIEEES